MRQNHTATIAALAATAVMCVAGLTACAEEAAKAGDAGAKADEAIAARIGDREITLSELDEQVKLKNPQAFQAFYDARRAVLEEMINTEVVNAAAGERGITDQDLYNEVTQKVPAVTDADVEKFFKENEGRMGGRTLEQMGPQIRGFLENTGRQSAVQEYLGELQKKSNVKVLLDPPRMEVEVAEDDPSMGPADAPVTLVEFSDFQCPYCARVTPTIEQIKDTYGDKVRIVFRDLPLAMHQDARLAGEAAECADDQGKFWEYHDKLFANQRALKVDDLKRYATELGLDAEAFNTCVDSGTHREEVNEDMRAAQALGISGTPAFFINGRFLNGAQPFEAFAKVIDEELAREAVN